MTTPASPGAGAAWTDGRTGARACAESAAPVPVPPPSPSWPWVSSLELRALPTAVACGRLHATQMLWEWKLDHLADDGQTLVSELLTNAVRAARTARGAGLVTLRLLANQQQLIIEVWDTSPHDPQPMRPDVQAEHGRGLAIVQALTNRWGHQRLSVNRKVVWCELLVGKGESQHS